MKDFYKKGRKEKTKNEIISWSGFNIVPQKMILVDEFDEGKKPSEFCHASEKVLVVLDKKRGTLFQESL